MAGCNQVVAMLAVIGLAELPAGLMPGSWVLLAAKADVWERLAIYGVLLLAVLAMIAAAAVFVKRNYFGSTEEQGLTTSELLSNFRELYSKGELSDEEYRTIKTKLAARFQTELKDSEKES